MAAFPTAWFAATVADVGGRPLQGVFVWSGVLVVLVLIAFVGYSLLRRWMRQDDDAAGSRVGFTLADIRDLHRRGEMSDEEFEATRAQLVGAAKRAADRMPPVLPRPPTPRPPAADDEGEQPDAGPE
jgi:uncharacterized membrane protein